MKSALTTMCQGLATVIFVLSWCITAARAEGTCNGLVTAQALLASAGSVVLHALSCPIGEGGFDVTVELLTGGNVTQREHLTGEGLAYVPSIDPSLDVDGDGVRDVGIANGAGRARDGMIYWLVKGGPLRLVRVGEAPRLSLSTDGNRFLYALVPGSGEVQATRVEYRVSDGQLRRVRSLQFVPIDDLQTEVREMLHGDSVGSTSKEPSVRTASNEAAQRCMDGGSCP